MTPRPKLVCLPAAPARSRNPAPRGPAVQGGGWPRRCRSCTVVGIRLLRWLGDLPEPKFDMVRGQGHAREMTVDDVAIIVGQRLGGAASGEVIAQCSKNKPLELGGGNTADRSRRMG